LRALLLVIFSLITMAQVQKIEVKTK
jgi:hypothetical protein